MFSLHFPANSIRQKIQVGEGSQLEFFMILLHSSLGILQPKPFSPGLTPAPKRNSFVLLDLGKIK